METKDKIIQARNILSEVFNENKDYWDKEWVSNLCHSMGSLDLVIKELGKKKNENKING